MFKRLAVALVTVGIVALGLTLAACQPTADHEPFPGSSYVMPASPASNGDPVPVLPCEDTGGYGPCTYLDRAPDSQTHWFYVTDGGRYPNLGTIDLGIWGAISPAYVPLCSDDGTGPCAGVTLDGRWVYAGVGYTWPDGVTLDPCAAPLSGPVPCVWVPSAHGNTGDSGVYVYGSDRL